MALALNDRYRVFNLRIAPVLKDTYNRISNNEECILFVYKYKNNELMSIIVLNLQELKDIFLEENNEIGEDIFESSLAQIKKHNKENDIYICVFHYDPRDNWCPSIYSFARKDILTSDDIIMGEAPLLMKEESSDWFSDKILLSMFNCVKNNALSEIIEKNPGKVIVLTRDEIMDKWYSSSGTLDYYMDRWNKSLVSRERQEFIKEKVKMNNVIIFNVINYLRSYFLLFEYNDKYEFKMIPTPGDTSLEKKKKNNK